MLICLTTLLTLSRLMQPAAKNAALNAEMSKAVPFIKAPAGTAGWVGDVGLDPLNFSEYFDMKWLRESEIKHGRAAMLATVGFVMQQYWTLPGMVAVADSNMAPTAAGASSMFQIIAWMGVLEVGPAVVSTLHRCIYSEIDSYPFLQFWSNKGNVTMETMFSDPDRVPGDFGFDPMGLATGKSEEEMNEMKLKELKNGRLAMLAIGGMIHHNWVTGGPLF